MRVLNRRVSWRPITLIGWEAVLIVGVIALAAYIRLGADATWLFLEGDALPKAILIAVVCQACLYYADLYDLRIVADRREVFVRSLQALGATSMILAGLYYWIPDLVIGRGVFLIAAGLVIAAVVGWRIAFEWLTKHLRARERLLLVGTNQAAIDLARELHERRAEFGVEIVGFVDANPARVGEPLLNPGIVGAIRDIPAIIKRDSVDRVVISLGDARGKLPMGELLDMRLNQGVRFDHLASVYEEYTGKIAVENLRPSWLIFSEGFQHTRGLLAVKRMLDIAAGLVGVVVLMPLMLLVAAAVKLTSPGPVLYRQTRVGQHGLVFSLCKFRSMRTDAEAVTGPVWSAGGKDPRVTAIGRILRRTRLDEMPQLWNVFIGNMSLVGPRPERPEFVAGLTQQIPFYGQRHVVKPGLTGWAQVRYTYGASVEDAMQKLQYDLYYIKNMSIALDLYIVVNTIKTVLMRSGS